MAKRIGTKTGTACEFGEDGMPRGGNCMNWPRHNALEAKRVRVKAICAYTFDADPFNGEIDNPSIYVGRVGSATTVSQDPETNMEGQYIVTFDDGIVGSFCAGELDLV